MIKWATKAQQRQSELTVASDATGCPVGFNDRSEVAGAARLRWAAC